MNNLHIVLSEFRNASRIVRETASLSNIDGIDSVFILALHADGLAAKERIGDTVEVRRLKLATRNLPGNLLSQSLKYLEYTARIVGFCKGRGIGLVNVHALSLLPIGVVLKLLLGTKLVYDTHELETERNGLRGLRKSLSKLVERTLIRHAELVVVVGERIADEYVKTYGLPRPLVMLNAPVFREYRSNGYFRDKFEIPADRVIFIYQGFFSAGRGIREILDAFSILRGSDIALVFMGYGTLEKEIRDASLSDPRIFLHPAVDPAVVMEHTASADIGIAMIEDTCLSYRYCMPNKLFEYLTAGIPVIVSDLPEMSGFVARNGVGTSAEAGNPASLAAAMESMASKDLVGMKKAAIESARLNSWEIQERNMVVAYENMLQGQRVRK